MSVPSNPTTNPVDVEVERLRVEFRALVNLKEVSTGAQLIEWLTKYDPSEIPLALDPESLALLALTVRQANILANTLAKEIVAGHDIIEESMQTNKFNRENIWTVKNLFK